MSKWNEISFNNNFWGREGIIKFFFDNHYRSSLSKGVIIKRCSENMQQIYRRIPKPKCDFNKVALQLYWNHSLAWVFSGIFAEYFQHTFFCKHVWISASAINRSNSLLIVRDNISNLFLKGTIFKWPIKIFFWFVSCNLYNDAMFSLCPLPEWCTVGLKINICIEEESISNDSNFDVTGRCCVLLRNCV